MNNVNILKALIDEDIDIASAFFIRFFLENKNTKYISIFNVQKYYNSFLY